MLVVPVQLGTSRKELASHIVQIAHLEFLFKPVDLLGYSELISPCLAVVFDTADEVVFVPALVCGFC